MATSYKKTILGTAGLVSLWALDEDSGNAVDSLGANHGEANGKITRAAASILPGGEGKSAKLEGGWFKVPDAVSMRVGDTFTFEAWIYSEDQTTYGEILAGPNSAGELYVLPSGTVLRLDKSEVKQIVDSKVAIAKNTAYHLVVTKSGGTVKIYVNGVDQTGTVTNSTCEPTKAAWGIGGKAGGANAFKGRIQYVALYNIALSKATAEAHYAAGSTEAKKGKASASGTGTVSAGGKRKRKGKGTASGTGAVSAKGKRKRKGKGGVAGTGAIAAKGFVPDLPNRVRVRERPPMRQRIIATTPAGRPIRWSEDEFQGDNVFADLASGDSVPGGCKDFSVSLPRRPHVDYSDMQRGTKIEEFGAGKFKIWEGTLQDAPTTSGDRLAMDPGAVGYQKHLTDDESVLMIPIDADLRAWGEPSAQRKIDVPANQYNVNAQVQLVPAGTPDPDNPTSYLRVPAISHAWSRMNNLGNTAPDVAESWYDSGGVELGRIMLDFLRVKGLGPGDTNWHNGVQTSRDGATLKELLKDFDATTTAGESLDVPPGRFFLMLRDYYPNSINENGNWETQWRNMRVFDRSGIPVYGTWPNVGVLCSDVVAYALQRWAPLIHFSTGPYGTIKPTRFPIPHLTFKGEPTTVQEVVTKATRFEMPEWGVWPGQFGPTFHLNPRGEREGRKIWRVRSKQVQLRETGPSMDRCVNGVLVGWQDVGGGSRVIGPPGSGLVFTSEKCIDRDPENPANQVPGLRKWKTIRMKSIGTQAGAEETAARYIEMMKQLDGSGECEITGYVEDEHGAEWPYYCVRGGDILEPLDSSMGGRRYVIAANRKRASRSSAINLDAPPDTEEAALERLDVEYVPLGLAGS